MATFQKFRDVLRMSPDEAARKIEMDDNPWEVEQIRDEILKMQNFERQLKEQIEDQVTVSYFVI